MSAKKLKEAMLEFVDDHIFEIVIGAEVVIIGGTALYVAYQMGRISGTAKGLIQGAAFVEKFVQECEPEAYARVVEQADKLNRAVKVITI